MKNKDLYQPETDFPFSIGRPAGNALKHAGYFRLKQLGKISEAELLQLHGVGPKAVGILRELLKEQGMSFAGASKPKGKKDTSTSTVDKFMAELKHPFKAEVQAVRKIIKGVNKNITEEIKWKAPSFSYKGYMVTFNLWEEKRVHLVFHNGAILKDKQGLLEGTYPDRRMLYFSDMKDIKAKRTALEGFVKQWVKLMDTSGKETV